MIRLSRFLREHLDLRTLSPKDFFRLKLQESEKEILILKEEDNEDGDEEDDKND